MKLPRPKASSLGDVRLFARALRPAAELSLSGACGSGWNERLVPDRFGSADFTSACRVHDLCYETCGRIQSECDSRFHGDLQSACRNGYSSWLQRPARRACLVVADTYALAVQRMGGDAYRAAQRASHC